jgi:nitrogen regulatory protein P-II 1
MKVITATIQPFMLNKVSSALEAIEGFPGMTVTEARRFVRGRNRTERRALRIDGPGEKVCIEIITPDEKAQQIVESLVSAARTRDSGDGKVFVVPIDSAVRAKPGEADERRPDALLTLLIFNDFRVFQLASNK